MVLRRWGSDTRKFGLSTELINQILLKQDWKEKAQKGREDLDMGVLEDMKCPKCKTVLKRRKDFNYHIKDCQECECDIPGCGKLFNHKKKLERHKNKFISNVLNVKFAAKYLQKRET